MPTFTFTKHMSEERACRMRGNSFTGFISVVDPPRYGAADPEAPRKAKLDGKWGDILRLWVHDIDKPWQNYVLFSDDDADRIIHWLKKHENEFKGIIVHCAMGISRSAAIARFIAKVYDLPFDEREGMQFNRHVFNTLCKRWQELGYGEVQESIYLASTGASYAYTTGQ